MSKSEKLGAKTMADNEKNLLDGVSRRNLFHVLGSAPLAAVAATSALAQSPGQHAHTAHGLASTPKLTFERRVFDDHQWRTVQILCDLIIPADDRSTSATKAGVPEFIDDWLLFRKEQDG